MTVFARIVKVDEERREVTGRASSECVDRDGEMMDYSSSKPHFQRWSQEVFADSGGLSHGNVRAMHSNVAAGILTNIDFNDVERAIDVVATITDDQEWRKVISGTYTGLSIGGRYVKKWAEPTPDGKIIQRYTAQPNEVSLVDRPANPQARFFEIHKRDGRVINKAFADATNRSASMSPELYRFLQNFGPAFIAVKKANASRRQPLSKLFAGERPAPKRLTDATAIAIKKAYSAAGRVQVDEREIRKMLKRGRLRKLALPEQSSNGRNDSVTANTGASNNFRDETPDGQMTSRMGGQSISGIPLSALVNSSNVTPTPNSEMLLRALKVDLSRPKRWGS